MALSFPSKVVTILDVPEVWRFRAGFRYNFFVPDEKVNDSGDARLHGVSTNSEEASMQKRIPRWIDFSFDPADTRTNASVDNEFVSNLSRPQDVEKLIRDNMSKIQNEADVASKGYSTFNLQDRSLGYKASQLLKLSMRTRGRAAMFAAGNEGKDAGNPDRAAAGGAYWDKSKRKWKYTRAAASKLLNEITGDYVAGKWIVRCMGQLRYRGVLYYRTRSGRRRSYRPKWLKRFRNVKQYVQINEKFIHSIMQRSVADPTCPYMNEFSYKLKTTEALQSEARKNEVPGVISDYEYAPNIIPVSVDRIDPGEYKAAVKIIGYIIDKWELQPNRRYKRHPPIIVAGSSTGSAVDTKIKYGGFYTYAIRAIAMAQFQAIDEETAQVYAITGLISSRKSRVSRVRCREYRPPPPPGDLNFVWDYRERRLMVMWSFPVVSQRDIKRFQLFKRESIEHPFELQIEYDFDDSEIPDPRSETPRKSRVIEMQEPLTTYYDEEFTKDSVAIYGLCSIDAHDLSSNYSAQYVVWFDETKNKIMKKIISPSGAPKPYPNFYLIENSMPAVGDTSLTQDCIKASNHYSTKVFFDPEYLSIKDENDEDLGLWKTKQEGGSYKLQIINIDRQKNEVFDIEIDDLRTKK